MDLFAGTRARAPRANPGRRVAALCVASNSPYHALRDVEAFDKARDARTFTGGMPVVAHPPCRTWSVFTKHQAKAPPGEKELGLICAEHLKREGGVLEHPAHSELFEAAGLPMPGKRIGDLFTIAIHQAAFGYPMRKATWLCMCGVDVLELELPFVVHDPRAGLGDRRRQQIMSRQQRSATRPELARFLVDVARSSEVSR